ncbi:EI24 domain-containing protein [Tropicimonas sp. IMCC34011]|uniref:EI24 domain-containing protein n=1 Tax=Tropicimonas sp. IMCC34011 TaxID=2248759 RepID=UPI000E276F8C|nr:EI24 domain-containing protein [Tropicimonas sp. IMCC34011]
MILADFGKALAQMVDPRFLRVLLLGLGLTLLLLAGLYGLTFWLVGWLVPEAISLPYFGEISWVDDAASVASLLLMLVLSVFLMVPVASAFTGLFLEDVAEAVEAEHYPGLPPADGLPWGEALVDSAQFLVLIVAVNAVALTLYFFVGPLAPFLFWAVNGFLLGREYFSMVAMRRLGRSGARAARHRHRLKIWGAGALMAAPLSIPVVNLFIPILGAATFTHLFHRWEGQAARRSDRTAYRDRNRRA